MRGEGESNLFVAASRLIRRSSVASSFSHPLHTHPPATLHALPAAKHTQYRFKQPERSQWQLEGRPSRFFLAARLLLGWGPLLVRSSSSLVVSQPLA